MPDDPTELPGTTPQGSTGVEPSESVEEMTPDSQPAPSSERPRKSSGRVAGEWVLVIVVALLGAFVIRTFFFQTFYIPSGSMEPTLQIGDRIIVSKLSYKIHGVDRGNIVVFHAPPRESTACADPQIKDLVKRVIGLPGETISSSGNTVLINGKPLAQPWFPSVPLGQPIATQKIPANSYFVMGDNRTESCDSRDWGPVPQTNIIGHVIFRVWPISRIGIP